MKNILHKTLLFTSLLFLLPLLTHAQGECTPGSIVLNTQTAVDDFVTTYGTCNTVNGLTINGAEITNIDGLANITIIGNSLRLQNLPNLENLNGLANLTRVNNLLIENCAKITSLDAFSNLTRITFEVRISANPNLTSVAGLQHVTSGNPASTAPIRIIRIFDNPKLAACCVLYDFITHPNVQTVAIYGNKATCSQNSITADPANATINVAQNGGIMESGIICPDIPAQLQAPSIFTYQWAADPSLSATDIANPTITPTGTTTYNVTITGCNEQVASKSVTVTPQAIDRVYVKPDATGNNDGTTWEHAFTELQTGINRACEGTEIWVAAGTYQPTKIPYDSHNGDTRLKTFALNKDVEIYGGFAGTETQLDQRNPATNMTILDANNGYHTVIAANLSDAAILDGFTIQNANGDGGFANTYAGLGFYHANAGGVFLRNADLQIRNCIFTNNRASSGAGMMIQGASKPTLSNCLFFGNPEGYAIYIFQDAQPKIINCTITDNVDGVFNRNQTAIPQYINTIIYGNQTNVTITEDCVPTFKNCLVEDSGGSSNWSLTDATDLGGNIAANPLFVDAANDDFQLKSCSPALNAGDNAANTTTVDVANQSRIFDATNSGVIDLGTYEFQGTQTSLNTDLIRYVKADATGTGDGTSWANAFPELGDALAAPLTSDCDIISQIWVAAGTYQPTQVPYTDDDGTDERLKNFALSEDVEIYGGFIGTETDLTERDPATNVTIMDGNGGYHTLIATNLTRATIIDGFTIQGGSADQGGITVVYAGADFTTFRGGGMLLNAASPTINNCIFKNNAANLGSAFAARFGSRPLLTNCLLANNTEAAGSSTPSVVEIQTDSRPRFINCTITNNDNGIAHRSGTLTTYINTIIFANDYIFAFFGNGSANIRNSLIEGSGGSSNWSISDATDFGRNIDADPSFVDSDNGDYSLRNDSPAFNFGNNDDNATPTDLAGNDRIFNADNGGIIDLGAYELQEFGIPEIAVTGNDTDIMHQDMTPSSADNTDFEESRTKTFIIENVGTQVLTLGTDAVTITGAQAADFSVLNQPAVSILVGGSTTFAIRFRPNEIGISNAAISINNDDSDEQPFEFAIQGTGIATNTGEEITIDGPFCNGCDDPQEGSSVACSAVGVNQIIQGIDVSDIESSFLIRSVDFNQESFSNAPAVTVNIFCGAAGTVPYTPNDTPIYSQVYQTKREDNGKCVNIELDDPVLVNSECGTTIWLEFRTTGGTRCVGTPANCNGVSATGRNTYIRAPSCSIDAPQTLRSQGFQLDASFAINILIPFTIEGDLAYCAADNTTSLTATGDWMSYLWSNDATTPSIEVSAGTYSVTVTDTDGTTYINEVTVVENENPTPSITGDLEGCNDNNNNLDAGTWSSYLWSNDATTQTIEVGAGTHSVTVTDVNGCTGTDEITIENSVVSIDNSPLTVIENNTNSTATIRLSRSYVICAASVDYRTVDGTAIAGTHYASTTGTINFAVGQSTATIDISILGDPQSEADKAFKLLFENPTGGLQFTDNEAIITISDRIADNTVLHFDGIDDQLTIDNFDLPTGFTLEFWIKYAGMQQTQEAIFSHNNDELVLGFENGILGVLGTNLNTNSLFPTDVWKHVVLTVNSNGVVGSLLIDGVVVAGELPLRPRPTFGAATAHFGKSTNQMGFNGSFDEVRIWNGVRSFTEISNSMECEMTGAEDDLVLYFNFDDATANGDNTVMSATQDLGANAYSGQLSQFDLIGAQSNFISDDLVFTNVCGAPALAVEWLIFDAQVVDNQLINLNWQVAHENATTHYEVERSADGKTFENIGKVAANDDLNYQFVDKGPLRGDNFYRIHEVENSGRFSVSETKLVNLKSNATTLLVYPNPTTDIVHLQLPLAETENAIFTLIDIHGKTILQQNWSPELDLSTLPSGVYSLQIKTAYGDYQQRIVKQ